MWKKLSTLFLALLLAGMVGVLTGCEGDTGPAGDTTAADAAAAAAQAAAAQAAADAADAATIAAALHTNESCNVCHGDGAIADVAEVHNFPADKLEITDIVVSSVAGVGDTVTFDVGVTGLTIDNFRFYMADMVPAGTVTTTTYVETTTPVTSFDTPYFERWIYERGGTNRSGVPYAHGVVTDNLDGTYTYAFLGDLSVGDAVAPDFNVLDTQRLMITASATGYSSTVGFLDFVIPADGASSTEATGPTRVIVPMEACTQCHGDPLERAAHGGSYQSPQGCNVCHSPIGDEYGDEMQFDGAWLASLIHGIHQERADTTAWDWSEVTYPRHPSDCGVCHGIGGDMVDEWTTPKAATCGTCHNTTADLDHFAAAAGTVCSICHNGAIAPTVEEAHAVTTLKNDPAHAGIPNTNVHAYTSTLTLTPPANGTYYVAGEAPVVTLTTTNHATGDYNNPAGPFTAANLYVYGPRSKAVPILTPGSTTDPAFDPDTMTADQGRSMLISAAANDAMVLTDADGFKYQLQAIPDDLASGTYMVMAYATDLNNCSGVYRSSVCIDGWQYTTIQIGSATVDPKVAGDCNGCHDPNDWSTFYHRSYFGTDGCLACHDQSGNHADPIANRVHAVHSATVAGDLLGADWSEIEFPRDADSCEACHTSGNTSYIAQSAQPANWAVPCIGCHGDTAGAVDHMNQNGAGLQAH